MRSWSSESNRLASAQISTNLSWCRAERRLGDDHRQNDRPIRKRRGSRLIGPAMKRKPAHEQRHGRHVNPTPSGRAPFPLPALRCRTRQTRRDSIPVESTSDKVRASALPSQCDDHLDPPPLARMRRKKLRQIVLKCPERFGLQVTIHDASVQMSPSLYPKTAAVSVNRSFENRFHPADFVPQANPFLH